MTPATDAPVTAPDAPVLGLAAAAKACGLSVSTLRRRRPDLIAAGAAVTPAGWAIPVPALIALGLMPRVTPPDAPRAALHAAADGSHDAPRPDALTGEVQALRAALAAAETRAAVAEAIAAERERIISVQAAALRMLEASPGTAPGTDEGPAVATPQAPAEPVQAPARPAGRRRWLASVIGATGVLRSIHGHSPDRRPDSPA